MRMDCCKLRHIFSVFLNQRQHNGERRALPHFAVHRYGAAGKLHTIDMRWEVDMRLNASTSIETAAREKAGDNLLFLGFHGFSNDENEMIRIIDAIYDVPKQDASSTDNSIAPAQHPNYLSFRGTYERPYIGSHYWYPDGCSVEERRRRRRRRRTIAGFARIRAFPQGTDRVFAGRIPVVSHGCGTSRCVRQGDSDEPIIQRRNR